MRYIETTEDNSVSKALQNLRNGDRNVRQSAALTLGELADRAATPALINHLWVEQDFFVRETLSWAVTRVPDIATPILIGTLTEVDPEIRIQALHILSKIADPETAEAIMAFTSDANGDVASKARWALTRIADPRAIPVLSAHLGQGDDISRQNLTRNLVAFGEAAVPSLLAALTDSDPHVRSHAAETLCVLGKHADSAANALATALGDAEGDVRLSAAMALFDLRTPKSEAALTRHENSSDPRLRAIAHRARTRKR